MIRIPHELCRIVVSELANLFARAARSLHYCLMTSTIYQFPTRRRAATGAQDSHKFEEGSFLVLSDQCGELYRLMLEANFSAVEGMVFALNAVGHEEIEVFRLYDGVLRKCRVEIADDAVTVEPPISAA